MEEIVNTSANGAPKKSSKEPKVVHGVKLEKSSILSMTDALKTLGHDDTKLPTGAGLLVQLLHTEFLAIAKKTKVAPVMCDVCGGFSPAALDVCPFCGVGEDVDEVAVVEAAAAVETLATPANETTPEAPAAKKSAKRTKVKSAPAAQMTTDDLARKIDDEESAKAITVHPSKTSVEKGLAKFSEDDLNVSVREVHRLKGEGAIALWRLGAAIRDMHSKQLWKLRKKEDGTPQYTAWDQFCQRELGMTHGSALDLADVSAKFNETQVRAVGTTKCSFILRAPEIDQARILEETEAKGLSSREVKAEVKKARAERGLTQRNTGRKKISGKHTTSAKTTKQPDKITVAGLLGNHTVSLFTSASAKSDKPKVAKKFADKPVGVLEMSNRTTMTFALIAGKNGEWKLKVTTARDAS